MTAVGTFEMSANEQPTIRQQTNSPEDFNLNYNSVLKNASTEEVPLLKMRDSVSSI